MIDEKTNNQKKFKLNSKQKKIVVGVFLIGVAFGGSFGAYFGMQFFWNTQTPMVVVISESMVPTYNVGDLLFVKGESHENIQIGDVIVFDANGLWWYAPAEPIVHRVINKTLNGDTWYFETQGDNNHNPDPTLIPEERIMGVVWGMIPFIGWVKIVLTNSGLLIPLIVILVGLLIVSIIWDIMKEKEEKETKEKSQEIQKLDEQNS